jgi:hypothetical protein
MKERAHAAAAESSSDASRASAQGASVKFGCGVGTSAFAPEPDVADPT